MIKIVKNKGQCKVDELKGCKYLLYTNDFSEGEMYAKIDLISIVTYIWARLKGW